jgi:maltooligosyltrehalose synthase
MNPQEFEAMFKGTHTTLFRLLAWAQIRTWWLDHKRGLLGALGYVLWLLACMGLGFVVLLVWLMVRGS